MLLPLLLVTPALAWGPTGHRAVGLLAERHVNPETLVAIEALMGHESLARASTWPDEIRSDPEWTKKQPDWWRQHFINAEEGETFPASKEAQPVNIWTALETYEQVLADRSRPEEERRIALRWLVHLTGDAHQPLHAGKGSDRGGNAVTVAWFDEKTNLHSVWDEHLIEHTELSYTELVDFIDHPSAEQVTAWQKAPYGEWLAESRALLPAAYEIGTGWLSYEYAWRHTPTVERRLLQAGVRLAGVLDRALGERSGKRRRPPRR